MEIKNVQLHNSYKNINQNGLFVPCNLPETLYFMKQGTLYEVRLMQNNRRLYIQGGGYAQYIVPCFVNNTEMAISFNADDVFFRVAIYDNVRNAAHRIMTTTLGYADHIFFSLEDFKAARPATFDLRSLADSNFARPVGAYDIALYDQGVKCLHYEIVSGRVCNTSTVVRWFAEMYPMMFRPLTAANDDMGVDNAQWYSNTYDAHNDLMAATKIVFNTPTEATPQPQPEYEFDEQSFLEQWLPYYHQSQAIADLDDIAKILDHDDEGDEDYLEDLRDMTTAELKENENALYRQVLTEAFRNYIDTNYPEQN